MYSTITIEEVEVAKHTHCVRFTDEELDELSLIAYWQAKQFQHHSDYTDHRQGVYDSIYNKLQVALDKAITKDLKGGEVK